MSVAAQLRIALGALILLLVSILTAAFYVPHKLNASANESYVEDAIPLRSLVQDLALQMTNQKAAVQAYLVTRDEASLKPYYAGSVAANRDLAAMSPHAARHPSMARLVRRAVPQIADLEGVFAREIASVKQQRGARLPRPRVEEVDRAFEAFNATATLMLRETERFVQEAEDEQRSTYRQLLFVLGALGTVALLIGATLLAVTPRRLGQLYAAERRSRREAEARADAARSLEQISDGVVLFTSDGRLRFWNPAAAKLLELAPEALGTRLVDILPEWDEMAGRGGTDESRPVIVPAQFARGERWLSITSVQFEEGIVLAIRDVTEERALDQMRSEFLATASHELRTPMTAVYGAAKTLLQRGDELEAGARKRFVEMIVAEAERLARIVDDILLASRLEAGRLTIASEPVQPDELARSVLASAEVRAPQNIHFRLDVPPGVPTIACDPDRLRQVLVNVVDNAIKYSPEGGEVVLALSGNGDRLRFIVRDQGLGFPPTERERIFERFHRLDPDQTQGIGGTGLGLYISRELVERMRGRIWAESEPGRGSAFFVEIPVAR